MGYGREQAWFKIDDVQVLTATAQAIQVAPKPGSSKKSWKVWIPKSLIHDDSECYDKGHDGNLIIAKWIALREGLEMEGEDYEG